MTKLIVSILIVQNNLLRIIAIIVSWIFASIVISLPLIFVDNKFTVFAKTPYIAFWIAILSHAMIYK